MLCQILIFGVSFSQQIQHCLLAQFHQNIRLDEIVSRHFVRPMIADHMRAPR